MKAQQRQKKEKTKIKYQRIIFLNENKNNKKEEKK